MLMYSSSHARFKHSNLFTVIDAGPTQRVAPLRPPCKDGCQTASADTKADRDWTQTFNYELFNCNNFNIRYWSWNYRGCWHQTCPPIVPRAEIWLALIPITKPMAPY